MAGGKLEHAAVLFRGPIHIVEPAAVDLRGVKGKLNPRQGIGSVG
jgi:hypothetical protein